MGYNKLTGSQAILGGAVILTSPTIYTNLSTSTSSMKVYGTMEIEATATDATRGGIKLGGASYFIKQVPFAAASWTTATSTNFDSGFDLPAKAVVLDAFFDITTVGSSITLTAGTNLDPDGFLTGVATTPAGPKIGELTAGAVTYGDLMVDQLNTTIPSKAHVNYVCTGAKSVAIGRSATDLEMPAGNLYIEYIVPE